MRIGVDVGGTNTDAVLMEGRRVVAACKSPTTKDVESGVVAAIGMLLRTAGVDVAAVASVMIGTTQFINAFVERDRLEPIGLMRIAAPASTAVPPLCGWPADLLRAVEHDAAIVTGGYEFDGSESVAMDESEVAEVARRFGARGIRSVAVAGSFALVNPAMELRAADIIRNEIPGVRVSPSHALGRMGLIERENAAAMNASLAALAQTVVTSFRRALRGLGIQAPLFISQNDGTLMSAETASEYPVLTFASGPTNSMRGAALLSGLDDALVLDIGGTTSDIGCLAASLPRESAVPLDVGGVRTNFRMPDLVSVGLGGGSLVTFGDKVQVGPQSVGYELGRRAKIFGGSVLTATDIAVAAGAVDLGDRKLVAALSRQQIGEAQDEMHRLLENAIDRIKTRSDDMPLVLVGGGAILVTRPLKGVSAVHTPDNSAVANAVGAAIAQVGGEVDQYCDYQRFGRDQLLGDAIDLAKQRAIRAGADPSSLRVVEIDEIPVGYLPGRSVRVRVKAIGELAGEAQAGEAA